MNRNADLAKIHIAKKDLALDDDAYRNMLFSVARVRSAADLDAAGRAAVLSHLRARGWSPISTKRSHPGRPHNLHSSDRGPQLRKIEALLADAKRPWSYAHSIASRMFNIHSVGFCKPDQLHKIIGALSVDRRRRDNRCEINPDDHQRSDA